MVMAMASCFNRRVTWKRRVNGVLSRATGYELTRSATARPRAATLAATADRLEHATRTLERIAGTTTPPPPKQAGPAAARPREFPGDYDEDYRAIVRAVRPYTMTGNDKLHALISAARYVSRYGVPGAVIECGVWRGGSMHAAARAFDQVGDHSRDLYLFDTFEGMTEPTDKDVRFDGKSAVDMLSSQDKSARVWAYASLEDVQAGFAEVPYPSERVHYVKGRIEDTVPDQAPEQIAILRLDTDWYESTAHELEHLYPRLVPGGVLMIDDYGFWKGSREATDEFLDRTGERLLLIRMDSGRVAVKR
jgi:hypothetical protein